MSDEAPNFNRLVIFTNDPGEGVNYEAVGWILSTIEVLKFQPGLNPDLINSKRYALRFWRPDPPRQPELL